MRPRFSLRLVLLAFGLLAVALYVFVVRPTALAEKFVSAVLREDYDAAEQLMIGAEDWSAIVRPEFAPKPDRIYAEVMPREWRDLWRGERRIILRVARHVERNGAYTDWTEDTDMVAGLRGLEGKTSPYNVEWPTALPSSPPAIINPGAGIRLEVRSRTG